MRKLLLAAVAAISLSGCATTGGNVPNADDLLRAVQAFTVQACGFLPLIDNAVVVALVGAYFPGGIGIAEGAAVIGRAICAGQIVPPPAQLKRRGVGGAPVCRLVQTPRGAATVCGVARKR